MNELTHNDYKVLQKLVNQDGRGMSKLRALTKKQLAEETSLSLSTIKNAVKLLLKLKLIDEGIVKVRAKTYYINENGISELREVKKQIKIK